MNGKNCCDANYKFYYVIGATGPAFGLSAYGGRYSNTSSSLTLCILTQT